MLAAAPTTSLMAALLHSLNFHKAEHNRSLATEEIDHDAYFLAAGIN
jgi:hypothetical protein